MTEAPKEAEKEQPLAPCRMAMGIKFLIFSCGFKQKDLAKAWACGEPTVAKFLAGSAMPEPKTVNRIVSWLLEVQPQPQTTKG